MAADSSYWSDLLPDLLALVFSRLELVDFICAAATCRSWRKLKSRSKDFYVRPKSQIPWSLLHLLFQRQFRYFHSLFPSSDTHEIRLPEIAGLFCIGYSQGFLISLDQATTDLRAVNPISGARIPLPPISTIPDIDHLNIQEYWLGKAILSPDPGFGDRPRTVVITYSSGRLAFARPGDGKWSLLDPPAPWVYDILFHKNRLYAVSYNGVLAAFDFSNPSVPHSLLCNMFSDEKDLPYVTRGYLVESPDGQDLYYVTRLVVFDDDYYGTTIFLVFKLHELEKQWIKVSTLGDLALFTGYNQSLALSATEHPSIKRNSIYFTDDFTQCNSDRPEIARDMGVMGVFDLGEGSIGPLSLRDDLQCLNWPPPIWFTPMDCILYSLLIYF